MTAKIPALSREYLYVDVDLPDSETLENLLALGVQFAFMTSKTARPASGDWVTGSWEPGKPIARVLVGPSGGVITLTAATYQAWLRIDGAVERPVRSVGPVQVI